MRIRDCSSDVCSSDLVASCDAPDACSASYRVESMEPLGIVRAPAERQGEVAADAQRRSQIGEVSDRIRVGKVRHEDSDQAIGVRRELTPYIGIECGRARE